MIALLKIEKTYGETILALGTLEDAKTLIGIIERASVVSWDWSGKYFRDCPKETIPFSISMAPGEVMVAKVEPMTEPADVPKECQPNYSVNIKPTEEF